MQQSSRNYSQTLYSSRIDYLLGMTKRYLSMSAGLDDDVNDAILLMDHLKDYLKKTGGCDRLGSEDGPLKLTAVTSAPGAATSSPGTMSYTTTLW
jgi:hypothetical protein